MSTNKLKNIALLSGVILNLIYIVGSLTEEEKERKRVLSLIDSLGSLMTVLGLTLKIKELKEDKR